MKNITKARLAIVAMWVTVIGLIVGLSILVAQCNMDYHANHYGAATEYTVAAHVDKAETHVVKTRRYRVELSTTEALPDGSHTYTSNKKNDYLLLEDMEGADVLVTFNTDGFIASVAN